MSVFFFTPNTTTTKKALLEAKWRKTKTDVDWWISEWVQRRYGDIAANLSSVNDAWKILKKEVHSSPFHEVSFVELRPSFEGLESETEWSGHAVAEIGGGRLAISPNENERASAEGLWEAWGKMLEGSKELGKVETFKHDISILGREVLANLFMKLRVEFHAAYKRKDATKVEEIGKKMIGLIADMDRLLGTTRTQLLGKWLADARTCAAPATEVDLFEFNARNQVTMWGPTGEINDYARKSWSGLYSSYYQPRWSLFIKEVSDAVRSGKDFSQDDFNDDCLEIGRAHV